MKAEELQVGDWVINTNYQEAYQVAIIDAVADECSLIIADYATPVKMDDIEPIPITPEILEKNGFVNDFEEEEKVNDNGDAITFQGYSYQAENIYVSYCNGYIHAANDNTDAEIYIKGTSVHQLQHAFRLCGIDKEIIINPN